MAGVNHMPTSSNLQPCSGLKRSRTCIPFLPKDIIFKILLCLPVDIIYNVMRFVCREWYNIIKDPIFIDAHLQKSPTGILIQLSSLRYSTVYVEIGKHGVEITDLNLFPKGLRNGGGFSWFYPPYRFLRYKERKIFGQKHLKFPGKVVASCNGLVLVSDSKFMNCLLVANLISKSWVDLPPSIGEYSRARISAGLGCAHSCREYKVASMYYSDGCYFCAILTVGVDKVWRCIASGNDISCIPPQATKSHLFMAMTYSVGGYMHWASCPYVLSLEVDTENFYASVIPDECLTPSSYFLSTRYFLTTERCLCVMTICEKYTWELWALPEVKVGHWTKLVRIDLAAQIPVLEQRFSLCEFDLTPIALLKNGELVVVKVFHWRGDYMIYNVKTGATDFFESDKRDGAAIRLPCSSHVRSLVSLMPR